MEEWMDDLYKLPNISELEDIHLLTLRENCAVLEEKLNDMMECMSEHDRQILEAYMDMRNELEFQSVKTALRFGKAQSQKRLVHAKSFLHKQA